MSALDQARQKGGKDLRVAGQAGRREGARLCTLLAGSVLLLPDGCPRGLGGAPGFAPRGWLARHTQTF